MAGGTIGSRNAIVAGAWFLCHELVLSTARPAAVVISPSGREVTWILTVSKSDPQALGVQRLHKCICADVSAGLGQTIRADCAVHALWDQLIALRRQFPGHHQAGRPEEDLLLFLAADGRAGTRSRWFARSWMPQPSSKSEFALTVIVPSRRVCQARSHSNRSLRGVCVAQNHVKVTCRQQAHQLPHLMLCGIP